MTDTTVTLTADEKTAVKGALTHVWREVFDKNAEGAGLHLLTALAKLDPTYKAYLPYRVRKNP